MKLVSLISILVLSLILMVGCRGDDVVTPTDEPDGPSPEEQIAGRYSLIQFDYHDRRFTEDFYGHTPPLEPPIATRTLTILQGGTFSLKWTIKEDNNNETSGYFNADKWEASTTNIFLPEWDPLKPDNISYTWQGTTRTTLILEITWPPDFPFPRPKEQTFVFKRTE